MKDESTPFDKEAEEYLDPTVCDEDIDDYDFQNYEEVEEE